jgi:hypothetical protein
MILAKRRADDFVSYEIDIHWDAEAGVWCAVCDDIPLALESNSFDSLVTRVKIVSPEILALNNKPTSNVRLCFKTSHWEQIA